MFEKGGNYDSIVIDPSGNSRASLSMTGKISALMKGILDRPRSYRKDILGGQDEKGKFDGMPAQLNLDKLKNDILDFIRVTGTCKAEELKYLYFLGYINDDDIEEAVTSYIKYKFRKKLNKTIKESSFFKNAKLALLLHGDIHKIENVNSNHD